MIGRRFASQMASLEFWRRRKVAYQLTFRQGGGDAVLADLADFCHAFKTTEAPGSDRLSALREGRRQVWLRIMHHLELTPAQLSALYRDIVNDTGDEV